MGEKGKGWIRHKVPNVDEGDLVLDRDMEFLCILICVPVKQDASVCCRKVGDRCVEGLSICYIYKGY